MKITKNEKRIKRYGQIGAWISIAALLVLGGGMYLSFGYRTNPQMVTYTAAALVVGFILTQIGMYLGNRYGRSPRPDEKLDAGLKGLQNDYSIYHYSTPVPHLLIGPAGVWALLPYHQRGKVAFVKNRWRISGGGFLQNYMRIFGQEGLGRPDLDAESEIRSLKKFFAKSMDESAIPEINAALVFTSDDVDLDAGDTNFTTMKLKQLKDFMRQKAKERPISALALSNIRAALE